MSPKLKNPTTTTAKRTPTRAPAVKTAVKKAEPISARLSSAITQDHISDSTPMGATLTANGATFRVWAPNKAVAVHLRISDKPDTINSSDTPWEPSEATQLLRHSDDSWTGFLPGVRDGDYYRFYISGRGEQPYKRDPYARELEF